LGLAWEARRKEGDAGRVVYQEIGHSIVLDLIVNANPEPRVHSVDSRSAELAGRDIVSHRCHGESKRAIIRTARLTESSSAWS
jgi:hypothetical protein